MRAASRSVRNPTFAPNDGFDQVERPRCAVTSIEPKIEPDEQLTMAHDLRDSRCEAVRSLRTELLLRSDATDRADIVALLSPCAGEGRSRLAAELAIAFAQTGRSTLLVDADLRHPQQHRYFQSDNELGLAQALEFGEKPRLRSVRSLPRLAVLTAGEVPDDPLQLFSGRDFASMIEGWRDEFKFVVIDTAPVARFSDGLAVASLVGRVLVLSRARHTPDKDMQNMLRRLAATRAQILGAVISHF